MSNFPPETYSLTFGASIVKLMSTITGPAGGGSSASASSSTGSGSVSSTYFTDLDNSLGAALGFPPPVESLPSTPTPRRRLGGE